MKKLLLIWAFFSIVCWSYADYDRNYEKQLVNESMKEGYEVTTTFATDNCVYYQILFKTLDECT